MVVSESMIMSEPMRSWQYVADIFQSLQINGANIVEANISALNGFIHVIDKVGGHVFSR